MNKNWLSLLKSEEKTRRLLKQLKMRDFRVEENQEHKKERV